MQGRREESWTARRGQVLFLGWQVFLRDFKVRYRRAALGFFWALAPLISLSAAVLVFGSELGLSYELDGLPYSLHVMASLVIWQVFSEAMVRPQQMAKRSLYFLARTPVPPEAVLVASAFHVLFSLAIKLPVLAGLLLYHRVAPGPTAVLSLAGVAVLGLLGLGLGAVVAPLSLLFLDFRYSLPFIQGALLLATPVFYAMPPDGAVRALNLMNPLTYLVLPARDWLLLGRSPLGLHFAALAVLTLVLYRLTVGFYRRAMAITVSSL